MTNCTVTGNSASDGGGIWCYYSSPTISNCIFWNDSPQEIYLLESSSPTVTYSDIQGGYTGEGNINADPLFDDPGSGNYHLQSNSPCINTGTGAGAPSVNRDNIPRPIEAGYEMGAYEYQPKIQVYPGGSVQTAIDSADDWYEIIVHPGTYYENLDFHGKAITVRSTNPHDPGVVNSTIIDGSSTDSVVRFQSQAGPDSVLQGLTIRNGQAGMGGGIYCYNYSSPTISNCLIKENVASALFGGTGGGIACYKHSSPFITKCTIVDNSSSFAGGGIRCLEYSSLTMVNCSIVNNPTTMVIGKEFIICYNNGRNVHKNIQKNLPKGGSRLCYRKLELKGTYFQFPNLVLKKVISKVS